MKVSKAQRKHLIVWS